MILPGLASMAASNPYAALRLVLGGSLHPGGEEATDDLLERADVGPGDTLVDLGCGAGEAVAKARELGTNAWGLDAEDLGADVHARMGRLPLADARVDVVLSECALCLSGDLDRTLAEVGRIVRGGGRLAFSDVTLDRALPEVPPAVAEPLCLTGNRGREHLLDRVQAHGFVVEDVDDHRAELEAMRDRLYERVDVDGLLEALGDRGERLREALEAIEAAFDAEEVGYVSAIARREPN